MEEDEDYFNSREYCADRLFDEETKNVTAFRLVSSAPGGGS